MSNLGDKCKVPGCDGHIMVREILCSKGHAYMDSEKKGVKISIPPSSSAQPDVEWIQMPFGKHKGTLICDLPIGYIEWALENMTNLRPDLHDQLVKAQELNGVKEVRTRKL